MRVRELYAERPKFYNFGYDTMVNPLETTGARISALIRFFNDASEANIWLLHIRTLKAGMVLFLFEAWNESVP